LPASLRAESACENRPIAKGVPRIYKFAQAARLVDTDDTKIMKKQHPHDTEGM